MSDFRSRESFYKGVKQKEQKKFRVLLIIAIVALVIIAVMAVLFLSKKRNPVDGPAHFLENEIPTFRNEVSEVLNDNIPYFDPDDYGTEVFENYSELDAYGRCGVSFANICKELMPTEPRGEIGQIKPSGWHQEKYPGIVDSEPPYLYNRCHLIGFQLGGENDNEKNLITGTRFFNVNGMLPYENAVKQYVDDTDNHVLYRVTPIYEDENLVASGVIMEAWSVEDSGRGLSFNVFVHNVQPGVVIDYSDGSSKLE